MKREFDGIVKLTSMGNVNGIKAEKLIIGDVMMVNGGELQTITKIEDISKSYIMVTFEYESVFDHKLTTSEKKIKKDRIVPMYKLFEEVETVKAEEKEETEIVETFESVETEIEIVENELLEIVGLNNLIEGTGFNTITLECVSSFNCGKFNVKKGTRKTIDAYIWNQYKDCDYIESCGAMHPKSFYKIIQNSIIDTEYGNKLYNNLIRLYKKSNLLLGI